MKLLLDRMLDSTTRGLEKNLDLTQRRNTLIAGNVANAETPGFRAKDLNFAGELARAMGKDPGQELKKTNARHLDTTSDSSSRVVDDLSGTTRADGNNVDIDLQMGRLAYNSGKYSAATRFLRKKLGMLKFAIREARS